MHDINAQGNNQARDPRQIDINLSRRARTDTKDRIRSMHTLICTILRLDPWNACLDRCSGAACPPSPLENLQQAAKQVSRLVRWRWVVTLRD